MKPRLVTLLALSMAVPLPVAFGSTISLTPGTATSSVPQNGLAFPGTLMGDTGLTALTPGVGSVVNAMAEELVYSTSTGLDFFIQVVNNNQSGATDNLALVDARNFSGVTTSVGYLGIPIGGVAPSGANRTATGDTINFSFMNNGLNTLGSLAPSGQGNTSEWLEIDTNATTFTRTGSIGVQDGGTASMLAFAPVAPVPEPATAGLLCGGLALLGIFRRRQYSR